MKCARVLDLLPLAVGRDLDPSDQQRVEEHLKQCLACYREFRGYRDALAGFAVVGSGAAPDGFADEILERARAGEPGPTAPFGAPGATLLERVRYGLPLAATFLGFALAGFYLFGGSDAGQIPSSPAAPASNVAPVGNGVASAFGAFPDGLPPTVVVLPGTDLSTPPLVIPRPGVDAAIPVRLVPPATISHSKRDF